MNDKAISLLKELTEAHSVPGFEDEVRAVFVDELQGLAGELGADRCGNVFFERGTGPTVLLAGHMDEVGFRVQSITPDGALRMVTLGGWWSHTLLSQRVQVLTKSGEKVLGVIASQPPHFLSQSQRDSVLPVEAMLVDIGASSQLEVEEVFGISLGDPIAPVGDFVPLGRSGRYLAKAFDNRAGMACAIQATQILASEGHPNRLVAAGTVQEELGTRGARAMVTELCPDIAIVLEATPADDTPGYATPQAQGRLQGGVQIRVHDPTAVMNPRLVDLAVQTAQELGIPYQLAVRSSGGTDAGAIHQANGGVPTIVLGTPARYIHSHNSIIQLEDYLAKVKLSVALVQKLDTETVEQLGAFL